LIKSAFTITVRHFFLGLNLSLFFHKKVNKKVDFIYTYAVYFKSVMVLKKYQYRRHVLSHIEHKTDCLCELELDILLDDQGVGLDSKSIYYIYVDSLTPLRRQRGSHTVARQRKPARKGAGS
jgi:hypothetical protein